MVVAICVLLVGRAGDSVAQGERGAATERVEIGSLTYGVEGRTARCFSTNFLGLVRRETSIDIAEAFASVPLEQVASFSHPFVVFSGEGAFDLSREEVAALRAFVIGGGFVLASAGCSNQAWGTSFERAMRLALPEAPLVEIDLSHPIFQTLFNVSDLTSRKRLPVRMLGVEMGGRLVVLYSPQGLNDTKNVGNAPPGECCCCGGDEIIGAQVINAGALLYALSPS